MNKWWAESVVMETAGNKTKFKLGSVAAER